MTPLDLSPTQAIRSTLPRRRRLAIVLTILAAAAVILLCLALAFGMFRQDGGFGDAASKRDFMANIPPPVAVAPVSDPAALKKVTPDEAVEINAAIPVSAAPNPPARGLIVPTSSGESWMRALDCLTAALYYEAGSETDDGERAVAQVVLNRVRHPAFPATICGVVYQGSERTTGCQFTFTCDGSLARIPSAVGWARARRLAAQAMAGHVHAPVGLATHYHTQWVVPYWAPTLTKAAVIGAHIFYRWPGYWGTPPAFAQRYVANEPFINAGPIGGGQLVDAMGNEASGAMPAQARPVLDLAGAELASDKGEDEGRADRPPAPARRAAAERWVIGGPTRVDSKDEKPPTTAQTSP